MNKGLGSGVGIQGNKIEETEQVYPIVSKLCRHRGRPSWRPRDKNIGFFLFKKIKICCQ